MFHLVGNREEAEDLCQEVFLRIYKARKGYRPRAKFSTWLFTIANNLALNHLRSKGRNPSVPIGGSASDSAAVASVAQQLAGREGTPSAQMRQAELADLVREALAVLNEDQKLAVLLNKFEEMSYAEIADVMGRSPAAVKSLLARARNQLREQLEPYLLTGQRERSGALSRNENVFRSCALANILRPLRHGDDHGLAHRLGEALDALVFPWSCPVCGEEGSGSPFCRSCRQATSGTVGTGNGVGVSTMCLVGWPVRGFARWLCRVPRPFAWLRCGARAGSVRRGHSRSVPAAQA